MFEVRAARAGARAIRLCVLPSRLLLRSSVPSTSSPMPKAPPDPKKPWNCQCSRCVVAWPNEGRWYASSKTLIAHNKYDHELLLRQAAEQEDAARETAHFTAARVADSHISGSSASPSNSNMHACDPPVAPEPFCSTPGSPVSSFNDKLASAFAEHPGLFSAPGPIDLAPAGEGSMPHKQASSTTQGAHSRAEDQDVSPSTIPMHIHT
jgi:hypothetical protein